MSRWSTMLKEAVAREAPRPLANSAICADELHRLPLSAPIGPIGTNGNWQQDVGETRSKEAASEDFDERAALAEFGAGIPREWAEGFALLQTVLPPAVVEARRWQQVIDDAGHFIDRWASQAAALGWRTLDVFGVHRAKPAERLDAAGLVWCLSGAKVFAISERTAALQLRSGVLQSFRRAREIQPEAAAIWTLEPRDRFPRVKETQ